MCWIYATPPHREQAQYSLQETIDQQRLIRSMERLVRSSQRKIFLILDDLRVHHGKLVAAWLKRHTEKIEAFSYHPLLSYLFSQK